MKTSTYNPETDMDRIAREAKDFREREAKRIAEEREAHRRALEKLKLDEIASLHPDVPGKAKILSEKEEIEQKRLAELRAFELQRIASKDSMTDSSSQTSTPPRMGNRRATSNGTTDTGYCTWDSDTLGSLSEDNPATVSPLRHSDQEDKHMDSTDSKNCIGGDDSSSMHNLHRSSVTFSTPAAPPKSIEHRESIYFDALSSPTDFVTPSPHVENPRALESRGSVYYDTQSSFHTAGHKDASVAPRETPASIEARALFNSRGDETLGEMSADMPVSNPAIDSENEESLMARNDPTIPRRKTQKASTEEEYLLSHKGVHDAAFEIPIKYTGESFQVLEEAQVTMTTSMAPSRVDGRWSGRMEGTSSLSPNGPNTATGSISLDYRVTPWSDMSLGMIRGHELYHPLITFGGSLIQKGSAVGVTFYHNASILQSFRFEYSLFSLSFRHLFPNSRWVFISELSRRQELSFGLSNSKLSTRLAWSLRNPSLMSARFDARPKLSTDRRAHFYGEWKSGVWQIGASLIQSLHSQVATIGLGVRLYSLRGLEWIFSWNRGDASIRIPLVLTDGIQHATVGQALYFSMVSFLIQEGISEIWGWKVQSETSSEEEAQTNDLLNRSKDKKDAELQKTLMVRQAKRKVRLESEKEGLVIHGGVYKVEGGDEWDVTVPLQFWVAQSSLTLPKKSKSELLGFYDITSVQVEETTSSESPKGWRAWLQDSWNDLLDNSSGDFKSKNRRKGPSPTLTVRYGFQGQDYEMTIDDEEELILPNPAATKL